MTARVIHGDCIAEMRAMADASVDAIVTDPPYEIGMMGRKWDSTGIAYNVEMWAAALRVLKPGGHMLAFGGARTYHRMACAIEDAGFEIRDQIFWVYGSGFPKSLNVSNKLAEQGLSCSCHKSNVSCPNDVGTQGLHGVRQSVDADQPLSVGQEQDVRPRMQRQADRFSECSPREACGGVDTVRDLRRDGAPAGIPCGTEQGDVLQLLVPVPDIRGQDHGALRQHEGSQAKGCAQGGGQSGLEGRRHAEAAEGQLQGGALCAGSRVVPADGAEGRLHHGASACDGSDVRPVSGADGSGQSHRSQPVEQPSIELGAVADERGSQALGGWPVCAGCGKPVVPEGLGTALKPAHEPVVVARKPLIGTVVQNVLTHGCGALNIDASRVPGQWERNSTTRCDIRGGKFVQGGSGALECEPQEAHPAGRWPANVVHDGSPEVLDAFAAFGTSKSSVGKRGGVAEYRRSDGATTNDGRDSANWDAYRAAAEQRTRGHSDEGTAARFFFCAKASKRERQGSKHPTVKPLALMRYLCRLACPPGGTVLDMFCGTGTTLLAAQMEGFHVVGIEQDAAYVADARKRLGLTFELEAAD